MPIQITPKLMAQFIKQANRCVLLSDIDGTLSEFHCNPQHSYIAHHNIQLLTQLRNYMPIWLVTGRSIADAQRLIAPLKLPIIGSHGLEINDATRQDDECYVTFDNNELTAIKQLIISATATNQQWLVEQKPYSVALHFRAYPHLAPVAFSLMKTVQQQFSNWQLKSGKYVWEILPKDVNKGKAIEYVLAQYYSECCPIFIGDDVTDEVGFEAVQAWQSSEGQNGIGIKVVHDGDSTAMAAAIGMDNLLTQAKYYVNNVAGVTQLLQGLVSAWQD